MEIYDYEAHVAEDLRNEFPEWFKRNEIERRVTEMVFGYYDCSTGTLDVKVPLTDAIIATVTKKPGYYPKCTIYGHDIEGDRELHIPNVRAFIENVAQKRIDKITMEYNSPDCDRQKFIEWCRRVWR